MTAIKSIVLPENAPNANQWHKVEKFAALCQAAFAGASVLPNMDVFTNCLRSTGKNATRAVKLSLVGDNGEETTYQINEEWQYKINAETGETDEIDIRP